MRRLWIRPRPIPNIAEERHSAEELQCRLAGRDEMARLKNHRLVSGRHASSATSAYGDNVVRINA